ncbi:5-methylcytosine restriction system specificity protein McrC [Entomospira culicis]|uniref:5-methylcytosine-specific restriction enzyme subunit McrC n=1 Tax=Entomospira culicis TaxID=2719989 RepID=A0A968GEX0_9SPIO|nr:hypothetical protein [Entomospira culicis]NIZ19064.1 hypothetical protein [Entomospira culicis]NIZ69279.1 hypothetical protein [Entomospira culicis]WDI37862.1 hypothetical protein PVA46_03495 [Entomospira culicis]WDI39490.1 hypothetical protein PVA47_03500 [Entomospira culicis]
MSIDTQAESDHFFINKIPLNNIWWLLLYDSMREHDFTQLAYFNKENYYNEMLPLLFLRLFKSALAKRYKEGLSRDYLHTREVNTRVRGKIDIASTYQKQLLQQGSVAIRYDVLELNHTLNQLLLTALTYILKEIKKSPTLMEFHTTPNLLQESEALLKRLARLGIQAKNAREVKRLKIKVIPRNQDDRRLVNLAQLALHLSQLMQHTHQHSTQSLYSISRDPKYLYGIYERAIRNFFRYNLASYTVEAQHVPIMWQVAPEYPTKQNILPSMYCDILIKKEAFSLIVDTKFTSMYSGSRSAHLYQIYTYVHEHHASAGLLLYPSVSTNEEEAMSLEVIPKKNGKYFFIAQFSLMEKNYTKIESNLCAIIEEIFSQLKQATPYR